MQPYKGYFITSSAMPVHPLTRTGTLEQCVGTGARRGSSIVEVTRFQFERLTVSIKELPEWFGLEIARIVVDEYLPKRENQWQSTCAGPVPSVTVLGIVVPGRKQAIKDGV